MRVFVTGGSSGVGAAVVELLNSKAYDVVAPTSDEFDLTCLGQVDSWDYSSYDIIVNCAARNHGTYRGLHENSWMNQSEQINVNFAAPLLMAKQYTKQRKDGHFVYVTSDSIDAPSAYNIFMASSKAALRFSLDVLKRQYKDFVFSEVCPGKIKTNMLAQNFEGTKTEEEIEEMYAGGPYLIPEEVAATILVAIEHKLEKITILPH